MGRTVIRACTLNRSNTICANSEIYGLAGVGKIPYGFLQNSNGMRIIDILCVQNTILTVICEIQSQYSSLHDKLLLSMCSKPADVDNHKGLFAILHIYVASRTGVHHAGWAPCRVGNIQGGHHAGWAPTST